MLVLDHDRAGGYWGAVYVFTSIKGLQVIIDGPVGCENLPVTSVLHYTDGLPPHELPIVVTGLGRRRARPRGHRRRDEAGPPDARPGPAERGGHRLDRRDDRRRRHARGHRHPALPAAHHRRRPVAVRQPRMLWLWSSLVPRRVPKPPLKPRAEGQKPRVNIIGPELRLLQHPVRPGRDPPAGRRHRRRDQHGLPAGQPPGRRASRLADADVNVCMYREFGRMLCEALERPTCRRRSGCTAPRKFLRELGELLHLDPEPFIEREKHTTIKPIWDLWRSVTQDFFGTASFAVVANETYSRGLRTSSRRAGPAVQFRGVAQARQPRPTTRGPAAPHQRRRWSCSAATTSACTWPRRRAKAVYIPASFPGAIRRHTGTPFMGYAGATYLVQESATRCSTRCSTSCRSAPIWTPSTGAVGGEPSGVDPDFGRQTAA
jgi:chlorophyllide a reductase subunit Z